MHLSSLFLFTGMLFLMLFLSQICKTWLFLKILVRTLLKSFKKSQKVLFWGIAFSLLSGFFFQVIIWLFCNLAILLPPPPPSPKREGEKGRVWRDYIGLLSLMAWIVCLLLLHPNLIRFPLPTTMILLLAVALQSCLPGQPSSLSLFLSLSLSLFPSQKRWVRTSQRDAQKRLTECGKHN